MKTISRWFYRLLIWAGPLLVLLVMVLGGFLYWALGTETGTRWLLVTTARQLDGDARDVQGTVMDGVRIGNLSLALPDVSVQASGFSLRADWPALLRRRLHVMDLSAQSLSVAVQTAPDAPDAPDTPDEPFRMPALPVSITLDRLALGQFDLRMNGEPLPVGISDLDASIALAGEGGQLVLRSLALAHEAADVRLQGDVALAALQAPWPVRIDVTADASTSRRDSPLCVPAFVPTTVAAPTAASGASRTAAAAGTAGTAGASGQGAAATPAGAGASASAEPAGAAPSATVAASAAPATAACAFQLRLQGDGSLDAASVALRGSGQGLKLDAAANLLPSAAFPLKDARIDLQLGDGASLVGDVAWQAPGQHEAARSTAQAGAGAGAGAGAAAGTDAGTVAEAGAGAATAEGAVAGAANTGSADAASAADTASTASAPAAVAQADRTHRVAGTLRVQRLDLGRIIGDAIPPAVLGADSRFSLVLLDGQVPQDIDLDLTFLDGTRWNGKPLAGKVQLQARHVAPTAALALARQDAAGDANAAGAVPADLLPAMVLDWRIPKLVLDVTLGGNRVSLDGALGNAPDRLALNVAAPALADFWPGIPGGVRAQGKLGGSVAQHAAELEASYTPEGSKPNVPGLAPMQASLALAGGWGHGPSGGDSTQAEGWRGRLERLTASHAGVQVDTLAPLALSWLPQAAGQQWSAGATQLRVALDKSPLLTLDHVRSAGGHGRWETRGGIAQLHVTDARIEQLRKRFGLDGVAGGVDRGGVTVSGGAAQRGNDITLGMDWNLAFSDALEGKAQVRRLEGDLVIPWDTPVPVGLRDLTLTLDAARVAAGRSRIQANAVVRTERMGTLTVEATTPLHATAEGGFLLRPEDTKVIEARAEVADLGWLSLFSNLPAELGGAITANVRAESKPDGDWIANGRVSGSDIRVIYPDEGVRLLDGTLEARFENERFILERLYFPTRLRVEPKEWRTQEWVSTNPDAKGGGLTVTGQWHLLDMVGQVGVELYRYPILQRSDRYAMFSGKVLVDAQLPSVAITGDLTADAGWVDLDIVSGVPTVDGDVVVVRGGDKPAKASAPTDITMDLTVDLGPRFYITGYGVNSGLVGKLRLLMQGGRLSADGALNTRGGAIETYGQRLQLRRGTITFQGDLTSPVLDIEAVRSGSLAVQAGVRVAGTARKPRIDLISTPDVSDVEKLSWLLLGRGPDESGGDAALLFSVGTSFLGSGEPFYKRFGLDELSMRSGALGATGSVLPVESVVRGLDSGTSDIERKFIVASKNLSQGFTISVEQALSETGTVGRVSYRLARGLTAQLSAGTVNGLAVVYRWFSRD